MTVRFIRVAIIQQSMTADREDNLRKLETAIRSAADQGAQLVLLPELHNGLYFCQTESAAAFDMAEPVPGPTTHRLGQLADETGMVVIGSVFEKRASGLYHNTAVVLDSDGRLAGMYRKMHIPDDPGYYEKYYFTPGDLGFQPIQTKLATLGVLVCWDQWFPEAARLMALKGADLLFYPTAIGWDPRDDEGERQRQLVAWQTVQRGHAVANVMPVVVSNRVGFEPDPSGQTDGAEFWGRSMVVGPQGEILAQTAADSDEVACADVDLSRIESLRRTWPFFRDRRIDAYSELTRLYVDKQPGFNQD